MECIKCKKEHDGSFGSGKYCSRSCANSRVRTDEIKKKIGLGVKTSEKYIQSNNRKRLPKPKCKICLKTVNKYNRIYCSIKCRNSDIDYLNKLSLTSTNTILSGKYIPKLKSIKCNYNFNNKIIRCDSKVEYSCLNYFETNYDIKEINRCDFFILFKYKGKFKRYIPDFKIVLSDNTKYLIECKTILSNKNLKRKWFYYYDTISYKKKALIKYCKNNNYIPFFYSKELNRKFYDTLRIPSV